MGIWALIVDDTTYDLDALHLYVRAALGAGMPALDLVTLEYATLDGSQLQRTRARARVLTLQATLVGTSLANLHARKAAIIALIRRDRHDPQRPVVLRYTGGAIPLYLSCYYDSGLEAARRQGWTEEIPLRFVAPNPRWYSAASVAAPAANSAFTAGLAIQSRSAGGWSAEPAWADGVSALRQLVGGDLLALTSGAGGRAIRRRTAGAWTTLGTNTAAGETLDAIGQTFDGSVFVGGLFSEIGGSGHRNVVRRTAGGGWESLPTAPGGRVRALAVGPLAHIYAGGDFTQSVPPFNIAMPYLAVLIGSSWSGVSPGPNGPVYAIAAPTAFPAVGIPFSIAGAFTAVGAVAANHVAQWDLLTWKPLGAGLPSPVRALVIGPDGDLYAGGAFGVRRWTGAEWAALGAITTSGDGIAALAFGPDGDLYAGGPPGTVFDGTALNIARWNGSAWLSLGVQLGVTTVSGIVATAAELLAGGLVSGATTAATATTVTNSGSASVSPRITISAPNAGTIYQIVNARTGAALYFNLAMLAGETLEIDCNAKTIVSSIRGPLLSALLPGSQLGRWALLPGANSIGIYHSSATATAAISWTDQHWSNDG